MNKSAPDRRAFVVLAVLLVIGAINAAIRFPTAYNFVVYHLPAALLATGRTTFTPPHFVAEIIAGHPPLAHAVMGALILVTGRASAAAWLGLLGLTALLAGFRWLTGESGQTRWLLLTALAVPLVAVDLYVPYLDLWTGSWLALAVLAAVRSVQHGLVAREAWVFVAATSIAAWSDFHAWVFVAVLSAWAGSHWLWAAFVRRTTAPRIAIMTLLAASMISAYWPARNLHRFGNPTHPWSTVRLPARFLPQTEIAPAVVPADEQMPDVLRGVPQPVRFLASVLETGRWWSPWITYSNDMWDNPEAMPLLQSPDFYAQNANHRVGGWGVWTVALIFGWWVHWWRSRDPMALHSAGLFLLLVVAIAPLPHSHELRYSLGLPLGALACLVHFHPAIPRLKPAAIFLCLLITFAHVAWSVATPGAKSLATAAPFAARTFWSRAQRGVVYALPASETPVYWAGPDFRSFTIRPDGAIPPESLEPKP